MMGGAGFVTNPDNKQTGCTVRKPEIGNTDSNLEKTQYN